MNPAENPDPGQGNVPGESEGPRWIMKYVGILSALLFTAGMHTGIPLHPAALHPLHPGHRLLRDPVPHPGNPRHLHLHHHPRNPLRPRLAPPPDLHHHPRHRRGRRDSLPGKPGRAPPVSHLPRSILRGRRSFHALPGPPRSPPPPPRGGGRRSSSSQHSRTGTICSWWKAWELP